MNKYYIIFCVFWLISLHVFSQTVPQAINFQGVARRLNGSVIANKTIALKLTILDSAANGSPKPIHMEIQTQVTNQFGSFNLQIGKNFISDSALVFNQIQWSSNYKLLKIDFDTTAGLTFPNHFGIIQMITVPYAFTAGSLTTIKDSGAKPGDVLTYDGNHWVPGINVTYKAGNGISLTGDTISVNNGVPTGTIIAWAGDTSHVPNGWLLCDGRLLVKGQTKYPALWNVIGTYWGNDGNNGDFNLPDLRGRFLRGQDNGSTNDPDASSRTTLHSGGHTGDKVGSYQTDAFQGHWHDIDNYTSSGNGSYISTSMAAGNQNKTTFVEHTNCTATNIITDGTNGTPRTTNETRPKNAYVNYIIKY